MQVGNITIVSTSHIAQESVDEIREAFEDVEPDIVALELDQKRLQALMMDGETRHPPTLIARVGLLGYLFALIGSFVQKKLGGLVGTKPGVEMLTAAEEARERGKDVYLIDQDVEVTLRKLSDQVPLSEKLGLVKELLTGWFRGGERINIDLRKVPDEELVEKLTAQLKEKFPVLYNVLVEQRNVIMARALEGISRQNPEKKILAVMGAGHTKELVELLEERLDDSS